jgi:hypothetical protein
MPVAYTLEEGGEWFLAYPFVPQNWSSLLYEDGWIYDRVLEKLMTRNRANSPWRPFDWNRGC